MAKRTLSVCKVPFHTPSTLVADHIFKRNKLATNATDFCWGQVFCVNDLQVSLCGSTTKNCGERTRQLVAFCKLPIPIHVLRSYKNAPSALLQCLKAFSKTSRYRGVNSSQQTLCFSKKSEDYFFVNDLQVSLCVSTTKNCGERTRQLVAFRKLPTPIHVLRSYKNAPSALLQCLKAFSKTSRYRGVNSSQQTLCFSKKDEDYFLSIFLFNFSELGSPNY